MNKRNLLFIVLLSLVGVTFVDMMLSQYSAVYAKRKKRKSKRKKAKKTESTPIATQQESVLKSGKTMPIRDILAEVQKRTEQSHFIVAIDKNDELIVGPVHKKIAGSRSVVNVGLANLFADEAILDKQVTLKNDASLIKTLRKQKRLAKKTKKGYQKNLVYFELDVSGLGPVRFYNLDVHPQKVVIGRSNAAEKTLDRWLGK